MAEKNCENCASEFCTFIPPNGKTYCDRWRSNAPAVNRWIPCSERLPEPLQNVIICTDIKTVTVAWINGNEWYFADTGNGHIEQWGLDDVTHWMPLPEPPEGGADNG